MIEQTGRWVAGQTVQIGTGGFFPLEKQKSPHLRNKMRAVSQLKPVPGTGTYDVANSGWWEVRKMAL